MDMSQTLAIGSTCGRYAHIAESYFLRSKARSSVSARKMSARYFGYMALAILLVIVMIGAYYLGK
jgi:hypothetical protein